MEKLKTQILKLSEPDQSKLLHWLVSHIAGHPVELDQLAEALKRVQEWDEGKVVPLTHEEFWTQVDGYLNSQKQRKEG